MRFVQTTVLCSFVTLGALGGCANTGPITDADRDAIRANAAAWTAAVGGKQHDQLAALYTDDVVLMPMNAPAIEGRKAVIEFFKGFPPITSLHMKTVEIDGRGDLAVVRGVFAMNLAIPGAPKPVSERGKYMEVWRRQRDGSWKISRDIFNSDLPVMSK